MSDPAQEKTPKAPLEPAKAPAPTGLWNSLKPPGNSTFTAALTPGATTPGAATPGVFSFDEPFGEAALKEKAKGVDVEAVCEKLGKGRGEVHDGGLEGGWNGCEDLRE